MKKYLIITVILASCSVQKRHFRGGYYVHWKSGASAVSSTRPVESGALPRSPQEISATEIAVEHVNDERAGIADHEIASAAGAAVASADRKSPSLPAPHLKNLSSHAEKKKANLTKALNPEINTDDQTLTLLIIVLVLVLFLFLIAVLAYSGLIF